MCNLCFKIFTVLILISSCFCHAEWRSYHAIFSDLINTENDVDGYVKRVMANSEFGYDSNVKTPGLHITALNESNFVYLRYSGNRLDYRLSSTEPLSDDCNMEIVLLDEDKFEIARIKLGPFAKNWKGDCTGNTEISSDLFNQIKYFKLVYLRNLSSK